MLKPILLAALLGACGGPKTQCQDKVINGVTCVPSTAQAGSTLTLRVRPDGCANVCHGSVAYACSSSVVGQTVLLSITEHRCEEQAQPNPLRPSTSCTLACQIADPLDCPVAALAAGDYTVELQGAAAQTLLVRPTGTTECAAPNP